MQTMRLSGRVDEVMMRDIRGENHMNSYTLSEETTIASEGSQSLIALAMGAQGMKNR